MNQIGPQQKLVFIYLVISRIKAENKAIKHEWSILVWL